MTEPGPSWGRFLVDLRDVFPDQDEIIAAGWLKISDLEMEYAGATGRLFSLERLGCANLAQFLERIVESNLFVTRNNPETGAPEIKPTAFFYEYTDHLTAYYADELAVEEFELNLS